MVPRPDKRPGYGSGRAARSEHHGAGAGSYATRLVQPGEEACDVGVLSQQAPILYTHGVARAGGPHLRACLVQICYHALLMRHGDVPTRVTLLHAPAYPFFQLAGGNLTERISPGQP